MTILHRLRLFGFLHNCSQPQYYNTVYKWLQSVRCTSQKLKTMKSFTQNQPRNGHTPHSKPSQSQCPKHYCCCLRCGCSVPVSWRRRSSGHPAYPPGSNQLSLPADWPDTKQGMGRVIERLGWSWVSALSMHSMPACKPLFCTTTKTLYSNSQTSLYWTIGCRWQHLISGTWIPQWITYHRAPITTIRTQYARV